MKPLRQKIMKMGYDYSALDIALKYIRDEAPIIIHFNCGKVL